MLEEKLTLPVVPPEYLNLNYDGDASLECSELDFKNCCTYPFAVGTPFLASIVSARRLTHGDDVKKVVDICLSFQENGVEFQPGDTIGVIPKNPEEEVEKILKHLKLIEKADIVVSLSVKPGTLKKKACVPSYIPTKTTLRYIFKGCVDIRAPPKKIFLHILSQYTSDPNERRRLEELCSKEGSKDYLQNIAETRTTLLDLLTTFPSCCPPVERLLEHLPRLQARPYSIASSPLKSSRELQIVYSVLKFPSCNNEVGLHYGICTGWLDSITRPIQMYKSDSDLLLESINNLSLQTNRTAVKILMFLRKSSGFILPRDSTVPLILIGPGTGIAPFVGFLEHRALEKETKIDTAFGEIWLFFGCRYEDRDFLYRSELEKFIEDDVLTRLFLSFSRDKDNQDVPRYVQDNIKLHGREFVSQIFEKNATLFICGDAKNMGRDVHETIVTVIQEEKGIEEEKSRQIVKELQSQGRYLQDIWT